MKNGEDKNKMKNDFINYSEMEIVKVTVIKKRRRRTVDYSKKIMNDPFILKA